MNLIAIRVDLDHFVVRIDDPKYVWIRRDADGADESEYRTYIKVAAENADEAISIVLTKVITSEYRLIVDRLWAWR